MIFAVILLVLLLVSVIGNFGQLAGSLGSAKGGRGHAGPRLDEAILEDNDSPNKIAVVDLDGIITSSARDQSGNTLVDLIKAQLDLAKEDKRVKAVILKVDSPGGEVLASDDIYNAIKKFQEGDTDGPGKPVIASMGTPWSGLRDHDCGWWIEPSAEELARAMDEALTVDAATRRGMGERGRRWMIDAFSWPRVARAMIDFYDEVVSQRRVPR